MPRLKPILLKVTETFGFVKPDTGEVSPHTKIRIARKGSAIYEFYKQKNNLYGKEPTSPVLYWGSKDMDAGLLRSKIQKKGNKPGAIVE